MAPTEEPSASQRAYRLIRDGVLQGTYVPGSMIGEASLAKEFELSRTPVRLALGRLQQEGWIEIFPKRGAVVRGLSDKQVAELADTRLLLESASVADASQAQREQLTQRQIASIDQQDAALAAGDLKEFVELTIAFHRGFVEAAGNSVRVELYDHLADRHRFALFATSEDLVTRREEIIAEHQDLARLMRDGDSAGFKECLRKHVSDNGSGH
ncbi:GntR family transcriptional regulator [Glutamicibacter sp. JL.03c]|uniref:GntR family transcriptional regulator n=1 Tax=Glutamicibacter sp. JL.03c TaxID=2984842 RepID=UPI0021F73795|nr:GntR family transcriptional regulator [Glutamicibacter sp. JL.03c]UYQ77482.1 GntR family transcriptional regulator [Glutamicibacter sp. JL.03c]